MEEVKVDISGDMNVPLTSTKSQFDFASLNQWQKLPSPMEILQLVRKSIRPWSEFINTSNFKTAASMQRLTARFVRNLDYFKSNYIFVFIVLMIYCLITSPLILLVLVAVAAASHKIRQLQASVSIFGHQLSTSHQIMAINIASLPILFLVGAGSALFWTLGASCFVISLHAFFYNIDAIVTEDTEGFLAEVV
ncbi:prenylated Rab acceptor protein 1 [Glossina fuscipes]|uniref:PRA1 family protein n=2 Tax=Nemorhina TaxID=44051 RepID=A0A9C5Z231_9MUSC|nr:prenylated Rab acceptor protein 1 [Glossina fuscipes]XP_037888044.1 prenylated Rab acceptor protein 1 [Glossina fuscipes]